MIKLKSLLTEGNPKIVYAQIVDVDGIVVCTISREKMEDCDWHHSLFVPLKYQDNEDGRYRLVFVYDNDTMTILGGSRYNVDV